MCIWQNVFVHFWISTGTTHSNFQSISVLQIFWDLHFYFSDFYLVVLCAFLIEFLFSCAMLLSIVTESRKKEHDMFTILIWKVCVLEKWGTDTLPLNPSHSTYVTAFGLSDDSTMLALLYLVGCRCAFVRVYVDATRGCSHVHLEPTTYVLELLCGRYPMDFDNSGEHIISYTLSQCEKFCWCQKTAQISLLWTWLSNDGVLTISVDTST